MFINKSFLQSIIQKYNLNGLVESVKWEIKDKNLIIKFTSPDKSMLGEVTSLNNKIPLEDCVLGINNTTQLVKLLSITSDVLQPTLYKKNNINTKLIFSDIKFTLSYSLADLMIIPSTANYKGGDNYNIEFILDNESINSIIKAKSALIESEVIIIRKTPNAIEMVFGDVGEFSNKISLDLNSHIINQKSDLNKFDIKFNSNILKEIMYCNKEQTQCDMKLNLEGIMFLSFKSGDIKSEYYIVAQE